MLELISSLSAGEVLLLVGGGVIVLAYAFVRRVRLALEDLAAVDRYDGASANIARAIEVWGSGLGCSRATVNASRSWVLRSKVQILMRIQIGLLAAPSGMAAQALGANGRTDFPLGAPAQGLLAGRYHLVKMPQPYSPMGEQVRRGEEQAAKRLPPQLG